ncbi:MAG: hypothetical protein AB7N90_02190, partial [Vicinamibacterales bacterium]
LVARLGPTVAVSTGGREALTDARLAPARVVVVGAPDAVGAADAGRLERVVRVRGGTLVLLPDRAAAGPLLALMGGPWRERLEAAPIAVGPLRAGELLVGTPSPSAVVLARAGTAPVVVGEPAGRGRVVISGAMDAWRYRAEGGAAFDRFWQALVAEGAEAAGPELRLTLSPTLAAPGQRVIVDVRMRTMDQGGTGRVAARIDCADGTSAAIRLWPAGPGGTYRGEVRPGGEGRCAVVASAGATLEASAALIVAVDAARGGAEPGRLEHVVGTSGGRVAAAGDDAALAAALVAGWPPAAVETDARPMRSPWWLGIFVACLGGEWYLRRAAGLR